MSSKFRILVFFLIIISAATSAAWFDTSYEYRHNIGQTNTTQSLLGPLNGTSPINEEYDGQDHWIYGTWRGSNSEFLDIYHQNESTGGWNQTVVANSTEEYCVIQTLPANYTSCPKKPAGLVAYYPLDETGTYAWDHIGGYHGNLNGGTTQGVEGKLGRAYRFDGSNDYISGVDTGVLDGSSDYTVVAWVRPTSTHSTDDYNYVYSDRQNSNMAIHENSGRWAAFHSGSSSVIGLESNKSIAVGEWTQVVFRFKSGFSATLFEDAAVVDNISHSVIDVNPKSQGAMISRKPWDSSQGFFDGDIDGLRIYNRSLSQSEIKALYHNKARLEPEKTQTTNTESSIKNLSPKNINKDSSDGVELSVTVEDNNSDQMNITFYNSSDNSIIGSLENRQNGTYSVTWTGLNHDTNNTFYIEVDDGTTTTISSVNSFTTYDVSVSWNDNSDNENGFRIYNNASGSYERIGTTGPGTTSFTDTSKDLSDTYTCYRVRAYNQFGESSPISDCITP